MESMLNMIVAASIIGVSIVSVFYSFKMRRERELNQRGYYQAINNMWLGVAMLLVGYIFIISFSSGTVKIIIVTLLALLGLFNLYAGTLNYFKFKRLLGK